MSSGCTLMVIAFVFSSTLFLISSTFLWEFECRDGMKVGLAAGRYSGKSLPDLYRTPQALQRVFGPIGPALHCGVLVISQCIHFLTDDGESNGASEKDNLIFLFLVFCIPDALPCFGILIKGWDSRSSRHRTGPSGQAAIVDQEWLFRWRMRQGKWAELVAGDWRLQGEAACYEHGHAADPGWRRSVRGCCETAGSCH